MSLIINLHEKACDILSDNFTRTYNVPAAKEYLDVLATALSTHTKIGCFTLSLHGRVYNGMIKESLLAFIKKLSLRFNHFLDEQYIDAVEAHSKLSKKKRESTPLPEKKQFTSKFHCIIKAGSSVSSNKLFCSISIMVNGGALANAIRPSSAKKNILNLYRLIDKLWCEKFNMSSPGLYQTELLSHSPHRYVLLDRTNPFFWNYVKQMIVSNKYLFKPYMGTEDIETYYFTTEITHTFEEETKLQCLLSMAMYEYSFVTWYKEKKGAFRLGPTKLETLSKKIKKTPFTFTCYRVRRKTVRETLLNTTCVLFSDSSEQGVLTRLDAKRWIDNEDKLLFMHTGPHDEGDLIMLDDILDSSEAKLTLSSPSFFDRSIRLTNDYGEDVEQRYETTLHNLVSKRVPKEVG